MSASRASFPRHSLPSPPRPSSSPSAPVTSGQRIVDCLQPLARLLPVGRVSESSEGPRDKPLGTFSPYERSPEPGLPALGSDVMLRILFPHQPALVLRAPASAPAPPHAPEMHVTVGGGEVARGRIGRVYRGLCCHGTPLVLKLAHPSAPRLYPKPQRQPDAARALLADLDHEASLYHTRLLPLQGSPAWQEADPHAVVPHCYGYFHNEHAACLVLEDCGTALSFPYRRLPIEDRRQLYALQAKLHAAGLSHGDFARRNFVKGPHGIRLIDFDRARIHDACPGYSPPNIAIAQSEHRVDGNDDGDGQDGRAAHTGRMPDPDSNPGADQNVNEQAVGKFNFTSKEVNSIEVGPINESSQPQLQCAELEKLYNHLGLLPPTAYTTRERAAFLPWDGQPWYAPPAED